VAVAHAHAIIPVGPREWRIIPVGPREWRRVSRFFFFSLAGRGRDFEEGILDRWSVKNARGEARRRYTPTRRVLGEFFGVWSTKTGLPNDWIKFSSNVFWFRLG
jgi:hypothetical protein